MPLDTYYQLPDFVGSKDFMIKIEVQSFDVI